VLTAADCRRKAAECVSAAETATDRKTRADFCRAAQAWVALAQHVERDSLRVPAAALIKRSTDFLQTHNASGRPPRRCGGAFASPALKAVSFES
jgi:hypothetical protein